MNDQSAELRYLTFKLREMVFAVSLSCIREILPMALLSRPPLIPKVLEGFLNIGPEVLPVIRVDRVLDLLEKAPTVDSHLIVIKQDSSSFALLVDRVHDVVSVAEKDVRNVREHQTLNGCVSAQIDQKEKVVSVLAVDRLLLQKEHLSAAEFASVEQKRILDLLRTAG